MGKKREKHRFKFFLFYFFFSTYRANHFFKIMEINKLLNKDEIIPNPVTPMIFLPINGEIVDSLKNDGFIQSSPTNLTLDNPFTNKNEPKIPIRNKENNEEIFTDFIPPEDEFDIINKKQMSMDEIEKLIITKLNKLIADSAAVITIPSRGKMNIRDDANYLINHILPKLKENLNFSAGIMIFFDAEFYSGGNEGNIFRDQVLSFPKKNVGFWRIHNFDTFTKHLKIFFDSFEKKALEASNLTGSNV